MHDRDEYSVWFGTAKRRLQVDYWIWALCRRSEVSRGETTSLVYGSSAKPICHAEMTGIHLDAARNVPGIVAVFESAELVNDLPSVDPLPLPIPGLKKPTRKALAIDRARYVGDPIAVVLAENLYSALDARDLVEVDYEPLPAVIDPEEALAADAPILYDEFGSNVAFRSQSGGGDIQTIFENADRVVRLRVVNQRVAPSSLETRACMFDFDSNSGQFTAWLSSQAIYGAREMLASFLGLNRDHVHVYNAEVGGGFGSKTRFVGEEIAAAALAMRYGRPVKWIESRSENLQAQTHGRGQINYIEAAYQNDGRLLGLKVRSIADLGAFLAATTAMVPTGTPFMLNGPYQVQAVDSQVVGVFTNKVPTGAYRGAGRPEATYILERTIDRIAHELGLDPAEVRRRNFISQEDFPYKTVTGAQYDSGNYQAALDRALELADYAGWREKQRKQREEQEFLAPWNWHRGFYRNFWGSNEQQTGCTTGSCYSAYSRGMVLSWCRAALRVMARGTLQLLRRLLRQPFIYLLQK